MMKNQDYKKSIFVSPNYRGDICKSQYLDLFRSIAINTVIVCNSRIDLGRNWAEQGAGWTQPSRCLRLKLVDVMVIVFLGSPVGVLPHSGVFIWCSSTKDLDERGFM